MNSLIDKNISPSPPILNIHRINIDEDDDDTHKNGNPLLYRLTHWLHLIKRRKHESLPEVCKQM